MAASWQAKTAASCSSSRSALIFEINVSAFVKGR